MHTSISRRIVSSVKSYKSSLSFKSINHLTVKYPLNYSKLISRYQYPLASRLLSTSTNVISKNEIIPDPSEPPKEPKKKLSKNFDITEMPSFDEFKNLHLNNLTVVSESELAALDDEVQSSKDVDNVVAAIALRKLLHYHLYHGNAEYVLVYYNDLVTIEYPVVYEYDMIFSVLAENKKFSEISRLYKHFKSSGQKPTATTINILFRALGESGDIALIMEIYESAFANRIIPSVENLFQIVKCAAIAGEPKNFHRFYSRIKYKGYNVPKKALRLFSDLWGTNRSPSEYSKSVFINTFDFSQAMELNLRVRNYKIAIDLINECRDIFNIQPDAMMYETLLAACLRDGFLSEKAKVWKKRFHKYPKGIEVRTEHFEFAEFIKELQDYLGDSIQNAVPVDNGELIKINRTTRKKSKSLYKYYSFERYTSPFEIIDKYDWVPEYMKRKEEAKLTEAQEEKASMLAEIEAAAQAEQMSLRDE